MSLPIKKKYRDRHSILKVLTEKYELDFRPDMDVLDGSLSFEDITNKTQLSNEIVNNEIDFLVQAGEIYFNELRYERHYTSLPAGRIAYNDDKYITLGEEIFWSSMKNYTGLVAIVVAVFSLCWTIISSSNKTTEINDLKTRIEVLESK